MFRGTALGRNKGLFSILMFVMVGGCGLKYRNDITSVTKPYKEGRFQEAEEQASKIENRGETRDKLALVLEEGQAMRRTGASSRATRYLTAPTRRSKRSIPAPTSRSAAKQPGWSLVPPP